MNTLKLRDCKSALVNKENANFRELEQAIAQANESIRQLEPMQSELSGDVLAAISAASAPSGSNPFATVAEIPASVSGYDPGYKEYLALIRQDSEGALVITVLKNTIPIAVSLYKSAPGIYTVSCPSFIANKVLVNNLYPFSDGLSLSEIPLPNPVSLQAGPVNIKTGLYTLPSATHAFELMTYKDNALSDIALLNYPFYLHIMLFP